MPKKSAAVDLTTPESIALLERYGKIGLNASRSKDVAQSAKQSAAFQRLVQENDLDNAGLDEKQAGLCVDLTKEAGYENAAGKEKLVEPEVRYIVNAIKDCRLKSTDQVKGESEKSRYVERLLTFLVVQRPFSTWRRLKSLGQFPGKISESTRRTLTRAVASVSSRRSD